MSANASRHQRDFHIAPMLDVSTPEFRNFIRILSKRAILWTEMVVDETIIYSNNLDYHLAHEEHLKPIICQIGGRNSEYCGQATSIVEKYGYEEVNLNIDCPSSRVSGERKFGAILMKDSQSAYNVVSSMNQNAKNMKISVKTRTGIELEDGEILDTLSHLISFIGELRKCGCRKFYIHARKCVIGGLTPAQNRLVPPLNYPRVYELCKHFPDCDFVLNGGIPGLAAAKRICDGMELDSELCHSNSNGYGNGNGNLHTYEQHTVPCQLCKISNGSCIEPPIKTPTNLTGIMIGRACMENPAMFWDIDRYFYGETSNPCQTRREALDKYCMYLEQTYPRRCCDNDDRVTSRIPSPTNVQKFVNSGGCDICKCFYGQGIPIDGLLLGQQQIGKQQQQQKIKITSRVIDRSLRPALGIFFGLRSSKAFRRECDRLSRDKIIRNCGPAFILRKALSVMPSEALDQPFAKTEMLPDENIPLHVGPVVDGCKTKGCRV